MFNRKLKERIEKLERLQEGHMGYHEGKPGLVECEKCGCLLRKETATEGKSKITFKGSIVGCCYGSVYTEEEVIIKTYYCKIHKPKK